MPWRPALYDAVTPQTLALHESIGDLAAICMTLDSPTMRNWILRTRKGDLTGDSPASKIAEEFGEAFKEHHPLRDANNKMTVKKAGDDPHDLSEVLTGAVWKAMVRFHRAALDEARANTKKTNNEPMRARALGISARQISRILFRALDFMPPAETTFADYLRAVLRSDTLAREDDSTGYREVLIDEAMKRGIVTSKKHSSARRGRSGCEPTSMSWSSPIGRRMTSCIATESCSASLPARRIGCFRAATSSASTPGAGTSTSGR